MSEPNYGEIERDYRKALRSSDLTSPEDIRSFFNRYVEERNLPPESRVYMALKSCTVIRIAAIGAQARLRFARASGIDISKLEKED